MSLVRDQKAVAVNGVRESWRLQWDAEPKSACGPEDIEVALACPCSGFAYGEAGRLSLVRTRPGKPVERLELASFFKGADAPGATGVAVLQRWRPIPAAAHDEEDDWHHAADFDFLKRVHARGSTGILKLADYNHDGQATEFLLQVGASGCGKHRMVLVGVARYNPRLHVFASAEAPDQPLVLLAPVWAAVLRSSKPAQVVESSCDDPGSAAESSLTVAARRGVFHVQRETRPCAMDGSADRQP